MKKISPARHSLAKMSMQRGAVMIMIALLMVVFLGIAALVIDVSAQYVVRNQLQNAADAGALAGARVLYLDGGIGINPGTNQEAYDTARENIAMSTEGASVVEVDWTSGNSGDVQRGHWSFGLGDLPKGFYPNASTSTINIAYYSEVELDENIDFINAVRVVTRREKEPAPSFFARIFGNYGFVRQAEAVAYIGFAGHFEPYEIDLPIAICKQSIYKDGTVECNIGRMLNSGKGKGSDKDSEYDTSEDHNTAAWTDYSQSCTSPKMKDVFDDCNTGNPNVLSLGSTLNTSGGVVDAIINNPSKNQPSLIKCWKEGMYDSNGDNIPDAPIGDGFNLPDKPWPVTLLVINCPGNNTNCSSSANNKITITGAVNVNIVWILEKDNNINEDAPYKMGDWENDHTDGETRWDSFVDHFNLKTLLGEPAYVINNGFKKKSIYFLPECTFLEPTGVTGGTNFGVLAKIPVLVQ